MIDCKDLMIGDWVYLSERTKFPMRVVNVGGDYCYLDFEGNEADPIDGIDKYMMPIGVTEELLLRIGFEKNVIYESNDYIFDVTYDIQLKSCFLEVNKHSNSADRNWCCQIDNNRHESIGGFDFQYLHELQNGIRLITKSDLEIKKL